MVVVVVCEPVGELREKGLVRTNSSEDCVTFKFRMELENESISTERPKVGDGQRVMNVLNLELEGIRCLSKPKQSLSKVNEWIFAMRVSNSKIGPA